VNLTVNKATPSITWATPAAITYGTALSATQLNASSPVAGTFTYSPAGGVLTAGSQTLSVLFTPTDSTDYTTATASVNLTVNKATPSITWATPAAIVYGTALSAVQLDAKASVAGTFAYTPASGFLSVGSDSLSVLFTPTDTTDYTTATASVKLQVNPAALTVTASSATMTYGSAPPAILPVFSGLVAGDGAASLTTQPVCTTTATNTSNVGSYTTSCSGAVDANYTIAYKTGTLTVTKAVLTVTATDLSEVYGAVDPDNCGNVNNHLAYTVTGFENGQSQSQLLDGSPNETTTATSRSNVGSYPITITQGSLQLKSAFGKNYTLAFVNGTLTVTPASLYVIANSYSRRFNQPNPPFGYTVQGFVNGDNQFNAITGAAACCTTTATISSPAGNYPIVIAQGSLAARNGNYTFTLENGMLTVYNPNNRDDPHCDRFGNYQPNPQWDANNWPDRSSFNFYWGNGNGGPSVNPWQ
jgi:hypothetical protein